MSMLGIKSASGGTRERESECHQVRLRPHERFSAWMPPLILWFGADVAGRPLRAADVLEPAAPDLSAGASATPRRWQPNERPTQSASPRIFRVAQYAPRWGRAVASDIRR